MNYIIWTQNIISTGDGVTFADVVYGAVGYKHNDVEYDTVEHADEAMLEIVDDMIDEEISNEFIYTDELLGDEFAEIDRKTAIKMVKEGKTYATYEYDKSAHMIKYSEDIDDPYCGVTVFSVRPA